MDFNESLKKIHERYGKSTIDKFLHIFASGGFSLLFVHSNLRFAFPFISYKTEINSFTFLFVPIDARSG